MGGLVKEEKLAKLIKRVERKRGFVLCAKPNL